jgi:hypothetical protein
VAKFRGIRNPVMFSPGNWEDRLNTPMWNRRVDPLAREDALDMIGVGEINNFIADFEWLFRLWHLPVSFPREHKPTVAVKASAVWVAIRQAAILLREVSVTHSHYHACSYRSAEPANAPAGRSEASREAAWQTAAAPVKVG